jgi:hypothetical protein
VRVFRLWQAQLSEDAVHVLLDRPLRHPDLTGDARVGTPLGHQREDLALPRREVVERIVRATRGNELLDDRRIDDRSPPKDAPERVHELVDVRDAALQEIAAPLAAPDQVHRVLDLHVRGENENCNRGVLGTDHACGVEALGRVGRRHPDVHDHEVRPVLADEREEA